MADDVREHDEELNAWVEAMSRVPETYRRDILNSLLGVINEYERTQDRELLARVMDNLHTTLQLLSSPDFVKRYGESLEDVPEESLVGVEGWVARISSSVGA